MALTTTTAVENALNVATLGSNTITTTYVDAQAPHSFTLATSNQLLITDSFDPADSSATSVSVTDAAGRNTFVTGDFADTLSVNNTSSGADTVYASGTGETVSLGAGKFVAYAGAGLSTVTGGHSSIYAGSGAGTLLFADTSGSTNSADTLTAGAGQDQGLSASGSYGKNVLDGGDDSVNHYRNALWGGSGSDTLIGGGLSALHAASGSENLQGGRWTTSLDTLYSGTGNDTLSSWDGNSLIYGANTDGKGNFYTDGHNTIFLGSGSDTVVAGSHSVIYGVGLNDTSHSGTGVTQIEGSTNSSAADTIVAGKNDVYFGGYGNQAAAGQYSIQGGSGRLLVWNGSGGETITLGSGHDTINLVNTGSSSITGGTGVDTINYWSSQSNATIHGGSNTTVNIVDSTLPGATAATENTNGTTTYTFSGGHTLTVDSSVHIVTEQSVSSSLISFSTFKGNTTV